MFRRGDGAPCGTLDGPRSAEACERAFRALRHMGFGERKARRAVERARNSDDTETVLRRALSRLTRSLPPGADVNAETRCARRSPTSPRVGQSSAVDSNAPRAAVLTKQASQTP